MRFILPPLLVFTCVTTLAPASRADDLAAVKRWPEGEGACADTPLRITFDQPPVLGDHGKIEVVQTKDGKVVDTLDLGDEEFVDRFGDLGGYYLHFLPVRIEGNTATIRLHSHKLSYAENYTVRIAPGV